MNDIYLYLQNDQWVQWIKDKLHPECRVHTSELVSVSGLCIVDVYYLKHCDVEVKFPVLCTTVDETTQELIKVISCSGIIEPFCSEIYLNTIIGIALNNKRQLEQLQKENLKLTRKLQDRRIIEKAKYLLVKRASISEQEAYERMRSEAMNNQKSLRNIADIILINEE